MSRPLTFIMAVGIGMTVANMYYIQPLLHQVRGQFAITTLGASLLVTLSQIGYAAGLFFVVPLGDILPRRPLIVSVVLLGAVAMFCEATAHSYLLFAGLCLFVGVGAVASHIIVPFGADLANPTERGRVVGQLMTGLLVGVLLSRTLAGAVAQAWGWRSVYVVAGGLLVILAAVLWRALPPDKARPHEPYRQVVLGSVHLLRTSSLLRRRGWLGGAVFGALNVMWTGLAFHLGGAPFHYSTGAIGLFGLIAVGGVVAANIAGRQADQSRTRRSSIMAGLFLCAGFVIMLVGARSIPALALGIILIDVGTQGMQITNQAIVYTIAADMRSRINAAYMLSFFTGGAIGSVATGAVFMHFGWTGTCFLGLGFGLLAVLPAWLLRSEPVTTPATEPSR